MPGVDTAPINLCCFWTSFVTFICVSVRPFNFCNHDRFNENWLSRGSCSWQFDFELTCKLVHGCVSSGLRRSREPHLFDGSGCYLSKLVVLGMLIPLLLRSGTENVIQRRIRIIVTIIFIIIVIIICEGKCTFKRFPLLGLLCNSSYSLVGSFFR